MSLFCCWGNDASDPENDIKVDKIAASICNAAERGESKALTQLLTENSTYINCRDTESGYSPLHIVSFIGHVDAAVLLVERFNASLDEKDRDGRTPLLVAAMAGEEAIVRLLIANGANVSETANNGLTPFMAACWRKSTFSPVRLIFVVSLA